MSIRSQSDIVALNNEKSEKGKEVVDKIRIPGLSSLHLKPKDEIAEVLINLLKSRHGVTEVKWRIGEDYISLSYIAP